MQEDLLRLENIGKEYDKNRVLKDISFSLKKGEILGLVGENGAGKSTLMNILFGMKVIKETGGHEGKIYLDGKAVNFKDPVDALNSGIGMVHQEFSLIPGFTVAENIALNMEKTNKNIASKLFGKRVETIDRQEIENNANSALDKLKVNLDIDSLVSEMPVGYKQFIEIAREINRENVKLIILDEPTAVLTETEADTLLNSLNILKGLGVSIIFISHRPREIVSVCDKIVVLRDGLVVVEKENKDVSIKDIATWMIGRDISQDKVKVSSGKRVINDEDYILEVENLWVDMPGETVRDVSIKVRRGEIFGIGGLAGQGKLGIPNGLMGLFKSGGKAMFDGKPLKLNNTLEAQKKGLAFVSEDRRGVGLLLDEPIDWNIAFNAMQIQDKFLKRYLGGLISSRDNKKMAEVAIKYIDELEIRCTDENQLAKKVFK